MGRLRPPGDNGNLPAGTDQPRRHRVQGALGKCPWHKGNAETAARLFESAARELGPQSQSHMGLDVGVLRAYAEALRDGPPPDDDPEVPGALRFDFVLRPE